MGTLPTLSRILYEPYVHDYFGGTPWAASPTVNFKAVTLLGLPQRKTMRLQEYDYSQNGAYFITICTQNRQNLLSRIVVGDAAYSVPILQFTSIGEMVYHYIENISHVYNNTNIDKYVIMPNHIHMIVLINDDLQWAASPTGSIPRIVNSFKTLTSKRNRRTLLQRSYHDHIIRGKQDYQEIWRYIDENPIKWELDRYYNGKLD